MIFAKKINHSDDFQGEDIYKHAKNRYNENININFCKRFLKY